MISRLSPFLFQFHYGTIKRRKRTSLVTFRTYFNSTMVRLKVGRCSSNGTFR